MKNFVAFDLEIAEPMEDKYDGQHNSCAGLAFDEHRVEFHQNRPYMTSADCQIFVKFLKELHQTGSTIVTWNGSGFDFMVLAQQSGMLNDCIYLNKVHIDLMFTLFCLKGFPLSLQKACEGMGLKGKKKQVQLKDGTILDGMSGVNAPALWQRGETEAVLSYLHDDVAQLHKLTKIVETEGRISWVSNRGRFQTVQMPSLLTVHESMMIPMPDTSWMSNRLERGHFVDWMKNHE